MAQRVASSVSGVTEQAHLSELNYAKFADAARRQVGAETFGEDLGQNSWLTAEEWRTFIKWLELAPEADVLDVGCGSGGSACFLARTLNVRVTGVDLDDGGIATASEMAREQGLERIVRFRRADASRPLPFDDRQFDAVVCIDSIHQFPDRRLVLSEWHRVLKPGGRVLFTDPVVVTGVVSNEELAPRGSVGFFVLTAPGENERLIAQAGLELTRYENVNPNVFEVANRWHDARARHRSKLVEHEGDEMFDSLQRFLAMTEKLHREDRLSRYVFVARR
jgi:ubiquinone/menaquinone biosynthesis C-methylase UbiE